jgi:hypothetical protein
LWFIAAPSPSFAAYCLVPSNLHLAPGTTGQLTVVDEEGKVVSGTPTFSAYNTSLISISSGGAVTPLRVEASHEIGTWVYASINGVAVNSASVVRVLSTSYVLPYSVVTGANTALYYPTSVQGEVLSGYVAQFQLPTANDYAYSIQSLLMGGAPFGGAKQIFEVDMGETEQQRVCGISGNPIRIGWNIVGQPWQNCFLWDSAYQEPKAPRWSIFYHEMAHNFTLQSRTFSQGLGVFAYIDGLATMLGYSTLDSLDRNPSTYPFSPTARASIQTALAKDFNYHGPYQSWLSAGADFSRIAANSGDGPDLIGGMYLEYRAQRPADFDRRFFRPLQPRFASQLSLIVENLGPGDEHCCSRRW